MNSSHSRGCFQIEDIQRSFTNIRHFRVILQIVFIREFLTQKTFEWSLTNRGPIKGLLLLEDIQLTFFSLREGIQGVFYQRKIFRTFSTPTQTNFERYYTQRRPSRRLLHIEGLQEVILSNRAYFHLENFEEALYKYKLPI